MTITKECIPALCSSSVVINDAETSSEQLLTKYIIYLA